MSDRCSAATPSCLRFAVVLALVARPVIAAEDPAEFVLTLRHRVPVAEKSGQFHTLTESDRWLAAATAVVVCDVWDSHHCLNAVRRVQEMAPRMNEFLRKARRRGALIIHAPSDCMRPYEGHPARRRAQQARGPLTCRQTSGNGAIVFRQKSKACIRSISRTEVRTTIRRNTPNGRLS